MFERFSPTIIFSWWNDRAKKRWWDKIERSKCWKDEQSILKHSSRIKQPIESAYSHANDGLAHNTTVRKPADLFSLWHYLRPLSGFVSYFGGILDRSQSKAYFWQCFHGSLCPGILRDLSGYLHVSQRNTFKKLALCYQLSVQIEFLGKNYWERNVQTYIQKARGFSLPGFFTLPEHCKAEILFTTGTQRIVLMHANAVLYKAVRLFSQMSNATTSCSKGKRSFWNKAKQRNLWHDCFRLRWFQLHSYYILNLNMNNITASDSAHTPLNHKNKTDMLTVNCNNHCYFT